METNNISNTQDSKSYFPIFDGEVLKIYSYSKEWWVDGYLDGIKEEYSYKDIKVCENNIKISKYLYPESLLYGNGRIFDVLERFGSSDSPINCHEKSQTIAEVNYYPKLYVLLKQSLNSKIIDLSDIANYFKEYLGKDNFIEDERDIEEKDKNTISFNSVLLGSPEKEVGISKIKKELERFPMNLLLTLEKRILITDGKISLDINTTEEEFKFIKECYYIGKNNQKVKDYIENDLKYEKSSVKIYKKGDYNAT